jgi:hypothetical protein
LVNKHNAPKTLQLKEELKNGHLSVVDSSGAAQTVSFQGTEITLKAFAVAIIFE